VGDGIDKQYNLLVKDTAKLSDRRQIINTLYISANSILLGGIALLAQQGGLKAGALLLPAILIAVAGIPLCLDWRKLVLNYKQLLELRFEMLRRIEALPGFNYPIKTYSEESEKLYKKPKGGQTVLFGFSRIEVNIPLVFIALYLVAIAGSIALEYPNIVSQLHVWGILPR
jgi:hypothetical protein